MLFSRRKTMFKIMASFLFCHLSLTSSIVTWEDTHINIAGAIIMVEGLILPIIGIYRKVKGARIIGVVFSFYLVFRFDHGADIT